MSQQEKQILFKEHMRESIIPFVKKTYRQRRKTPGVPHLKKSYPPLHKLFQKTP